MRDTKSARSGHTGRDVTPLTSHFSGRWICGGRACIPSGEHCRTPHCRPPIFTISKNSSQRTECAARLLSGVSLVRSQGEEPFQIQQCSDVPVIPPLFCPHGAIAASLIFTQQTPERYRVRVPLLHRLIVQKENGRLTSGRPGSITSSGDHFIPPFLRSSKAEPSPDKRETAARYRAEGPRLRS